MNWKRIGLTFIIFMLLFLLFNLTPIIPTTYDVGENNIFGLEESRLCPLNYLVCFNTMVGDNYPLFLQNQFVSLFLLLILPILLTILIDKKLIAKYV